MKTSAMVMVFANSTHLYLCSSGTLYTRGIQLKLKEVQLLKFSPSKGLNLILSLEIVYPDVNKKQRTYIST